MTVISQGPIDVVESSLLPEGRLTPAASTGLKSAATINQACERLGELVAMGDTRTDLEADELIRIATSLQLRWNDLDLKGDRRSEAETNVMGRMAGALQLVPEIIASNSAKVVETEAAKAPTGSTGQLKVGKRTRTKKEVPPAVEDQSVMVCLHMTNGTFKLIESEVELIAAKNDVLRDPSNFRLVSGRAVVPTITWG